MTPGRVEARLTVPSGGAAVSATNSGGGPTACTVPSGDYFLSAITGVASLLGELENRLNASRPPISGAWSVTLGADGRVTINCSGTWSLTWTSTVLRDVLGFAADINAVSTAQTGTKQARGLWIPGCTFDLAGDPRMAPKVTDLRSTESPTGVTLSLRSTYKLEHNRLQWSHVTIDHVRESSAPYAHGSWEWFLDETQFGLGASWFPVGSLVQIYDHAGNRVGEDVNVAGWSMQGVRSFDSTASLVIPGYTGLWDIHIPRLVAKGG